MAALYGVETREVNQAVKNNLEKFPAHYMFELTPNELRDLKSKILISQLKEAANAKPTYKIVKGKRVYEKSVPVYLQSVSNLCNQLLCAGTSIGANNAEATNAVSKTDYRAKSYIALKEARESLYWIELLHRNNYIDDKQYQSIYTDCEELVKILVTRCKKLDQQISEGK